MTYLEQYNKELKRIKRFIRAAEKRGYVFPESIMPKRPKRITAASVRVLKRLTPDELYKKSQYVSPQGKRLKGTAQRSIERSMAGRKAAATRKAKKALPPQIITPVANESYEVLNRVRGLINEWSPPANWGEWFKAVKERDKNTVLNILNGAISSEGENAVAARLQAHSEEVIALVEDALYGSGKSISASTARARINADLSRLAAIIKGQPLTPEEARKLNDMMDQNDVIN